jgi:hypothetical protein
MKNTYRQGDVLLVRVDNLPKNVEKKDNILALGEKTGHYHEIVGDVQTFKGGDTREDMLNGVQWVVADEGANLEHKKADELTKDHDPLSIDPGIYKVVVQREYEAPNKQSFRDWD